MNNPFDFFDKIFCINLAERADRWEQCLKDFEKYGIKNYERIEAIKVNSDQLDRKRKGQIGCALSFAKCFELANSNDYEKVLVLEDDFDFAFGPEELFLKIENSISDLPADWDALYFGGTVISDYGHIPIKKYTNNLFKLNSAHCLHCTAFSKKGIEKIFNYFQDRSNWSLELINKYENMDVFLAKDYQYKNNCFITSELLCYQKINLSNIEYNIYNYSEWMSRNFNHFKSLI